MGLAAGAYGISAISSLTNAYSQAQAMKAQGKYEKTMADINARNLELRAEDVKRRGDLAAGEARRKGLQVAGSQQAALASSGIDPFTGSPAGLVGETMDLSQMDEMTIRNNAWREAWGLTSEAENVRSAGRVAKMSGRYGAKQTMLTGGLNFATNLMMAKYYQNKNTKTPISPRPESTDWMIPDFNYGNRLRLS